MSYLTGTATGQNDLLNDLATFMSGVTGWTVTFNGAASDDATDKIISLSHTPVSTTYYHNLVARNALSPERISLGTSTAFNSGVSIYNQTGTYATSETYTSKAMIPFSGTLTYWFFAISTYCHVAIRTGNYFQYLSFGEIDLQAGYTNGIYSCGTKVLNATENYNANSYQNPLCTRYGTITSNGTGYIIDSTGSWELLNSSYSYTDNFSSNIQRTYVNSQPYPFIGINSTGSLGAELNYNPTAITHTLIPVLIFAPHPSLAGRRVFAGYLEDVYVTGIDNITLPIEIIIGADTYVLLPYWQLGTDKTHIAIKKIT